MQGTLERWSSAVIAILWLACSKPGGQPASSPSADQPAGRHPPPSRSTAVEEPNDPTEPGRVASVPPPPPLREHETLGQRSRLDDRTEARVRSAVRRRIGTRPNPVLTLHYRRPDGGTTTITAFTASYVERCMTLGSSREACLESGGPGTLATNFDECAFGGIARIDTSAPVRGRDGPLTIVGVEPLGLDEICSFEVEALQLVDEDGDSEPEVLLRYGWHDLRYQDGARLRMSEGTVRRTMRADLSPQVTLRVRDVHHDAEGLEPTSFVTQVRHVPSGDHFDLAVDVFEWSARRCSDEEDPPRGRAEECSLQSRTIWYRYDPGEDGWNLPPSGAPLPSRRLP